MTPVTNLLGKKFNRLTVIARAENDKQGKARWLCLITDAHLKDGNHSPTKKKRK